MEIFCPLCAKNGIKRRIKAFQINLEEAMWSCESEECIWPIGYEELTFFNRAAASCNWEEPREPTKENMNALIELSLYTPPVTPGDLSKESTEVANADYSANPLVEDKVGTLPQCEFITSKESTRNKSSLFESQELEINSTEENGSVVNEQIADVNIFRTLPKITNIEKTNINITIFPSDDKHCDNKQIREHKQSLLDATIVNTFKNFDISDSTCTEFNLNVHYKTEDEQSECGKLQSDATVSGVETNFGTKTLDVKTLVDTDGTNSLNTTDEFTGNISDIDTLLEDILNGENHLPVDLNDDWLNMLMS